MPGKFKTLPMDDVHHGDIVACILGELRTPLEDARWAGYFRYRPDGHDEVPVDDGNPYGPSGSLRSKQGRYDMTIKGGVPDDVEVALANERAKPHVEDLVGQTAIGPSGVPCPSRR